MSHRSRLLVRTVTLSVTAAIGLLFLAPPAMARVDIVPDQAAGGDTETFAFRMANERPDLSSTRLELDFPQDPPIAYVKVDPFPGWTATITPRPLNPPAKVGDQTISQVAASLVLQGGSVRPHQFNQFMITLGPLPRNGRLVFSSIQTFTDGSTETLTVPPTPGQTMAAAPVITIGVPAADAQAPQQPANGNQGADSSALAVADRPHDTASGGNNGFALTLLWIALGIAVLVIVFVGVRTYLRNPRAPETVTDTEDTAQSEGTDPAEMSNR